MIATIRRVPSTLQKCVRATAATRAVHVEAKIEQLGYKLPGEPAAPKGSYTNFIKARDGKTHFFAGHLPQPAGGEMILGTLGENMSVEDGQEAARACGLQLLASMKKAAGGDLDKVTKIVKLVGFVNSTKEFTAQPSVINGCSDLMGEVFGTDIGRHARSAVGVNVLPLGVAVEIEAIVEIDV